MCFCSARGCMNCFFPEHRLEKQTCIAHSTLCSCTLHCKDYVELVTFFFSCKMHLKAIFRVDEAVCAVVCMKSLVTGLLVAFAASEQRKPAASCLCSVETSTASIWMQILQIRTWIAASWVTVPFEPSWDVPPSCSNPASPPSPSWGI